MSRSLIGVVLSIAIAVTAGSLWYLTIRPSIITPSQTEQNTAELVVLGVRSRDIENDSLPSSEKLYGLINGFRREQKTTPLAIHASLEQSARAKLNDMIVKKYWRHGDTDNNPPWRFFTQSGYHYALAGENLAFGVKSNWDVFLDWQESQTHREQLLQPEYQHMGVAIECDYYEVYAGQTCLVVLHLGTPL